MRKLLLKFILFLIGTEMQEIKRTVAEAAREAVGKRLAALQALDVGFEGEGKIILLATVDGRDIVKIYHMERRCSLQEYKERCLWIENVFGARAHYEDLPRGAAMDFGTFKRR